MKDDFGILEFEKRRKNRKLIYNPTEINDKFFKTKIRDYSIAYKYINRLHELW